MHGIQLLLALLLVAALAQLHYYNERIYRYWEELKEAASGGGGGGGGNGDLGLNVSELCRDILDTGPHALSAAAAREVKERCRFLSKVQKSLRASEEEDAKNNAVHYKRSRCLRWARDMTGFARHLDEFVFRVMHLAGGGGGKEDANPVNDLLDGARRLMSAVDAAVAKRSGRCQEDRGKALEWMQDVVKDDLDVR